ncbi:MAG: GNAT family N-acetyltransferase [Saprospiraceae bacterium]|jgi:N-acetyltransferase|nr:GNAT family N-acetyltransferase [Saprospiraceae bacterium]
MSIYPPLPITIEGNHILIKPLTLQDRDPLVQAASDGSLWNLWYTSVPTPEKMESYILTALAEQDEKKSLPFIIIRKKDQKIVGTTRYMNIETVIRRLEIGSTWYAKSSQRTGVNTECKYLLLKHAFESLGCLAVELRTHWINHQSRAAIERLGAKLDGVLRNHRMASDGTMRDTVVYSILNTEWPMVKSHLEFKLRERE